jgi:orotidine-5'-phosphate decarboxylase
MTGTLIVALDVDTRAEAEMLVERIGDSADFYKIGYQLIYGGDGLAFGKALIARGKRVFFDLKLLDIDNTVEHVLGVTVLTSMDDQDVADAGYGRDVAGLVELRAQQARTAGIGGLVCSPREAAMVRQMAGPSLAIVTPGIRLAGGDIGDQKRVTTPAMALEAGATHLVVGRPITAASDPAAAARNVRREMLGETQLA